jgi:hypothetical protein
MDIWILIDIPTYVVSQKHTLRTITRMLGNFDLRTYLMHTVTPQYTIPGIHSPRLKPHLGKTRIQPLR